MVGETDKMFFSYTIVIPVYNAEKYVSEMIESVIAQTYLNWNMVIIDDGSTDNSGMICEQYSNEKIQIYHCENQGQMIARITGIMKATGDYTLVLDADDYLEKDCLKKVNDVLNQRKYDMVLFPYMQCDEKLIPIGEASGCPDKIGELGQEDVLSWVVKTYNHGLVNKVIKTELIQKGAKEATRHRLTINGDYALIIPIICHIKTAYFIDEVLYFYRIYGLSLSHNTKFQHIVDTDYVSLEVIKELKKYELDNEENVKKIYCANLHMIIWMMEGLVLDNKFEYRYLNELVQLRCFKNSLKYKNEKEFLVIERIELYFLQRTSHCYKIVVKCIQFLRRAKKTLIKDF